MSELLDVFNEKQSQAIVDTLLKGYRSYLDERLLKSESMEVSTAYAWVKPNHIDDAFAKSSLNFKYQLKKAGQAWGYLEFDTETEEYGDILLIIKGLARLNQVFPGVSKKKSGYLFDYAKINTPFLEKNSLFSNKDAKPITGQLELISELEIQEIMNEANQVQNFLILTYQADSQNLIVSVNVMMPDARNGKLVELQDLSKFIASSEVSFEDEKYQHLSGLSTISDIQEFGIIPRTVAQERGQ